jgi:hypothetical protein
MFLKAGANPLVECQDNFTAVAAAAFSHSLTSLKLVIDAGAQLNKNLLITMINRQSRRENWNKAALHHCYDYSGPIPELKTDCATLLLSNGADPNALLANGRMTTMRYAYTHKPGFQDPDIFQVQLLIDHGADVDRRDVFGWTFLYDSTQSPDDSALKLVLKLTKALNQPDNCGLRAIDMLDADLFTDSECVPRWTQMTAFQKHNRDLLIQAGSAPRTLPKNFTCYCASPTGRKILEQQKADALKKQSTGNQSKNPDGSLRLTAGPSCGDITGYVELPDQP